MAFHRSDLSSSVRHVLRDVYLTVRQVRSLSIVVQIMQCVRLYVRSIRCEYVGARRAGVASLLELGRLCVSVAGRGLGST